MMQNDLALLEAFSQALQNKDARAMSNCCAPDVQVFSPLYGNFNRTGSADFWQYAFTHDLKGSIQAGMTDDRGDGYYILPWVVNGKSSLAIKSYIRVVQGQITELSEAYSLHRYFAYRDGVKGYWLGWTGFYKRRAIRKARTLFG